MENEYKLELPAVDPQEYDLDERDLRAAYLVLEREFTPRKQSVSKPTYQQIADKMGIDRDTLLAIRQKDEFKRYVKDVSHAMISEKTPALVDRLLELALGSSSQMQSYKAILSALEMGGFYNPKGNDINVTVSKDNDKTAISDEELALIAERYSNNNES